jgi:long-chain acyl-CoA synthetase
MAIMAIGGIPAPIYVTCTEDQVGYIVTHSRATIAICDSAERLAGYRRSMDAGHMSVEQIICMDAVEDETGPPSLRSLESLRALGRTQDAALFDARFDALKSDEVGLLIYTSGTTGTPKAVMLTHRNLITQGEAILTQTDLFGPGKAEFRAVSYLPLCHVAEQVFTNILQLGAGGEAHFCDDLKQIKNALVDVRPTMFLGVPRVWEKFQGVLEVKLGAATGFKGWLTKWAMQTELEAFRRQQSTGVPQNGLKRKIANKMVISKVQDALGLDQLRAAATGAAPISLSTLEFFASIGIPIYEGYGMSETAGVATCPPRDRQRFGKVGTAMKGVVIRIADDDEILLKGPMMTPGYLHDPEKTAELLDSDGWLHTGDLGKLDDDGYLSITGRKKDILITAGGKNVAPAQMEGLMQSIPGVGQAIVVGDAKPYLAALITLDEEALEGLGERFGVSPATAEKLAGSDALKTWLQGEVETNCNAQLARYQTIKRFEIVPAAFSVEGGELTPTMKVKRAEVGKKYAALIEKLYA